MALREREVRGYVVDGDGLPLVNAKVSFKPTLPLGFTATHVIVDRTFEAMTDDDGYFSITLWCDEDSLVAINYNVKFPIVNGGLADDGHIANFSLAYGQGDPIDIGVLINAGIPSPTPQDLLYLLIEDLISEHLNNDIASETNPGHVKIDGITITADENGVISANIGQLPFTPSDLPDGLVDFWVEADQGVLNEDGDEAATDETVATVQDRSASGWDLTEETDANRPTLVTSDYNNKPAIYFNPANSARLSNLDFTGWQARNGQAWFLAFKPVSNATAPLIAGATVNQNFGVDIDGSLSERLIRIGTNAEPYRDFNGFFTAGGALWTIIWNGSSFEFYRNGALLTPTSSGGDIPFQSPNFSPGFIVGCSASFNQFQDIEKYALIHTRFAPTTAQRLAIESYLRNKWFANPSQSVSIVCEGDSITKGFGLPVEDSYPAKLAEMLGANYLDTTDTPLAPFDCNKLFSVKNHGQEGDLMTNHIKSASQTRDIYNRFDALYRHNILILMAGTNDLHDEVATATILADIQTYITNAIAQGLKVVIGTIPARDDEEWTSGMEDERLDLNDEIRTNWASWGAVNIADFSAIPGMDTRATLNTGLYSVPKLHPNASGYAKMAEVTRNALKVLD